MDPITGVPADLRGKVVFNESGGIGIHGGVGGAQWQEIQELFLKPHASVNPWARWQVNRTDSYSTARFVFYDGAVKASSPAGPGIDWVATVRALPQRIVSLGGNLVSLVANTLRAAASQFVGLFTLNASASCAGQGGGGGNTCFWVGGTGNWNDTTPTTHWAAATNGTPVTVLPNGTSNITIDVNSCTAACTLTLTPAYTTTGALNFGNSFMTLAMGGNSLSFTSVGGTCGLTAGGVTNTSGTFTCAGGATLSGGYYDGSTAASGGISWTSLTMSSSSYLKFGSSTADAISGNVSISDPSYIVFSSGTITVGGNWTDSTTSTSWVVGTATVLFNSASGGTVTPANFTNPEFYNVHFASTAAKTFSLTTRPLRWSGILTVDGTTGAGTTLDAYNGGAGQGLAGGTAGSVAVGNLGTLGLGSTASSWNNLTMTGGTTGVLTLTTGTVAVSGSWDSSGAGSTFTKSTSTVTMSGTGQTVKILNATMGFYNLTVSGTITLSSAIDVSNALSVSGSLTTSNNNLTGNSSVTVTATGILVAGSSSLTILSIDSSAVGATLTAGTSTVIMGATGGTIKVPQTLANLTVNAAVTSTLAANLTVGGTTTVNGVLAASTFNLTLSGTLAALSGGITAGASGTESIAGNVTINATGYFSFGGASWSFPGSWTNASTSASWAAGTGTVTFRPAASVAMTFAALPLAAPEFSNVALSPTAAATFTMATNALVWSGTLTLNSNATLATGVANLGLTGGNLTVGNGSTLAANGSTVAVANVTMTGGTSGTITLTTGSWTVSGNWDTSGAGSVFTRGTSTVTLSGAGSTVKILSLANQFNVLTITGSITLASAIGASALLTVTGTLDTSSASNFGLTAAAGLTVNGATGILRTNASTVSVTGNFSVNNAAGYITATGGSWTVTNGAWADLSTSASWSLVAPVIFISNVSETMSWGPMAGNEFGAAVTFDSSVAGGVTFASAANALKVAGALTIQNSVGVATANTILTTGANPYFNITAGSIVLGTRGSLTANSSTLSIGGNFTTTGANAAWTPGTSTLTFTASGTITLGAGQTVNALNVNGGTLTFGSAVTASGAVTIAGSMTTSASNYAFTAQSTFTINGTGSFSSGTSTVAISGAGSIATATAYITSGGAGIWTVSGTWSNASTSASWSFAAPMTFNSAASVTMTFAGTGITEFANVTFSSASTVAFTMATNPLKWSGTLTVQGSGVNTTTLNTSGSQNNGLTGGALVIGNSGVLTANNSTVSVSSVNMIGGTSGSLSIGTGAWTVAGSWNTSGTGSTWTTGTAGYTFTASGTITTLPAQNTFAALMVSGGTVTLASNIVVTNALTVSGGLFAKATSTLSTGGLVLSGGALTSTSGAVTINGAVSISSASSYIQFGSEAWTVTGTWSNSSTSASWSKGTATVTFNSSVAASMTFAGTNLSVDEFYTVVFSSSANAGRTFTLATRGLRATTIQVNDANTTTTLDTVAGSNFPLTAGTLTIGAGGILLGQGSTITVTSMDTSAGVFTPATSTVVVATSNGTINIPTTVANLTVNAGISTTFASTLTFTGALILTLSTPTFNADLTSSLAAATLAFASATISIAGSWNTSSIASMTSTSSTVTFAGTAKTITLSVGQSFATVTISGTISQASQLTASGILTVSAGSLVTSNNSLSVQGLTVSGGFLAAGISTVLVSGNVSVSAATAYITAGAGTWAVSGAWTNASTSASWSFAAGMTFNATVSQAMTFGNVTLEFTNNVSFQPASGTPVFTMSTNPLKWGGTLTIAACTLSTSASNLGLTGGALVVGTAGILTASASTVSVSSVTMTGGTSGTITLTSGAWAVSGNWDTSSAGSTFMKGTSTVTLSGTGVTVKTLNATNGFASLTVTGTATMSSAIDVSTALVVSGALTTSGNALTGGGNLTVQGGGTLTASTSSLTVGNVSMTDASVDTISLTTGSMSVSGNWDTSGTSAVLTQGTSSVTLSGAAKTVKMSSTQRFATLTVSGSVTQQSNLTATSLTVSGTLTKTSYTIVFNALTCTAGSIVDGAVTATSFTVTDNDPTALISITILTTWTVGAHYNWTHSDSKTTDTITFTIGGNTNGNSYVVTAGGVELTSGTVVGGNVTFTMSGSSSVVMDVLVQNCGGNRFWVGGTGNWSDPTHWSSLSGGASGCGVPTSGVGAVFDANSGAGTTTVNLNAAMASLTTTGSTITTIAIGSFNFAVSGNVTLAGIALTIGASAGTGLSATGSLTLSGSSFIDASAGASIVTVSGDVSISSATAYLKFGSGTFTFSGAWSNASTSASWAAGTGSVVFNSGSSKAMTFAALPGAAAEFYRIQFSATAAATFTMGSNGLVWSNLLTLSNASTLATSGLGLTGGSLSVGNGAVLAAGASTVSVANVTMTGGTSGSITVTSGSWSVSGNWDSSGAGSTFTGGTGTVTMSGSGATLKIATGQQFYTLNFTGASAAIASFLLVSGMGISAGPLDLAGFPLFVNGNLSITGAGSLNFDSSRVNVLGNIVDTSSTANTGSGTLLLAASATQSIQGGVWPNVQVVGGEKDFTANLTTLNVTLLGNANVTIRVTAGITWTLTAGGVLSGVSSSARLILTSSATWTLNVSGVTGIAQWVAVDHSTATSPGAQGFNSVDNNFNTNWTFPSGAAPLGPWLIQLQHDPVIQISISALGLVSILAVHRYHKKRVTCPVCGHKFTEECHDHE